MYPVSSLNQVICQLAQYYYLNYRMLISSFSTVVVLDKHDLTSYLRRIIVTAFKIRLFLAISLIIVLISLASYFVGLIDS